MARGLNEFSARDRKLVDQMIPVDADRVEFALKRFVFLLDAHRRRVLATRRGAQDLELSVAFFEFNAKDTEACLGGFGRRAVVGAGRAARTRRDACVYGGGQGVAGVALQECTGACFEG